MRSSSLAFAFVLFSSSWCQRSPVVFAQAINSDVTAGTVQFDLAPQVELKALVELVSQRLGIGILYDEQIDGKRLTLRTPSEIPVESLPGLLQSALRMKGFAMVDADVPGWKKIVAANAIASSARFVGGEEPNDSDSPAPITREFLIRHVNPQFVVQAITPFLSSDSTSAAAQKPISSPVIHNRKIMVTDFPDTLVRIEKLIHAIDVPSGEIETKFVELGHAPAADLAAKLEEMMEAKFAVETSLGSSVDDDHVQIAHDVRTNQIILIGQHDAVEKLAGVLRMLDLPLPGETKNYPLKHANAKRVSKLLTDLMKDSGENFRSAIDENRNLLFVTADPKIQQKISSIIQQVDLEPDADQNFIRTVKLQNVAAWELLTTLKSLEQGGSEGDYGGFGSEMGFRGVSGAMRGGGAFPGSGRRQRSNSRLQSGSNRLRSNLQAPASSLRAN